LLWTAIAVGMLVAFYRPIRDMVLPRLGSFSAFGVSADFLASAPPQFKEGRTKQATAEGATGTARVIASDPHRFGRDHDGVGCET